MAGTRTKRVTRLDREAARDAANASMASLDLRPVGRAALVGFVVLAFVLMASLLVPGGDTFGGPLQLDRLEGTASMTSVRKTKGDAVTFGLFVPWNTGSDTAVLEGLTPIDANGVSLVSAAIVTSGGPPIETARGFPPTNAVLVPIDGFAVRPGDDVLDGFQLVVELVGEGTVPAFALTYRVGDAHHVAILGSGVMLCTAACEGRTEASERQRAQVVSLAAFVDPPNR
jgi:hypothetical protein